MAKTKNSEEYDRFAEFTDHVLAVPHREIKEKLDAEKRAKKRKKSKVSSASHEAADKD